MCAEGQGADGAAKWTPLLPWLATFAGSPSDLEAQLGGKQLIYHQKAIYISCPS